MLYSCLWSVEPGNFSLHLCKQLISPLVMCACINYHSTYRRSGYFQIQFTFINTVRFMVNFHSNIYCQMNEKKPPHPGKCQTRASCTYHVCDVNVNTVLISYNMHKLESNHGYSSTYLLVLIHDKQTDRQSSYLNNDKNKKALQFEEYFNLYLYI